MTFCRVDKLIVVLVGLVLAVETSSLPLFQGGEVESSFLDEALDNELVKAELCGIGASTGYSIVMAIRSKLRHPLEIKVRSGTTLRSSDPQAQDMTIHRVESEYTGLSAQDIARACLDAASQLERLPEGTDLGTWSQWRLTNSIVIRPDTTQLYLLSGYCLDFAKENPSSQTSFTVASSANPETSRLFAYIQEHPDEFEIVGIQLATWASKYPDLEGAEIAEKFEFDEEEKDEACRLLRLAGLDPNKTQLCAD